MVEPAGRSTAWRLAAPAALAFALGSALVLLAAFLVIRRQADRELDAVLSSVAADLGAEASARPAAELESWLAEEHDDLLRFFAHSPTYLGGASPPEVVLMVLRADGAPSHWMGTGDPGPLLGALPPRRQVAAAGSQTVVRLRAPGLGRPLRSIVWRRPAGPDLMVAVSEPEAQPLLRRIAFTLLILWGAVVMIGSVTAWWSIRRALRRVERLTRAAAAIDHPESGRRLDGAGDRDEIARLATTLNHMLDRIAAAVAEIRSLTQAAAHDLRTPLTAVRGRLEMALADPGADWREQVAEAVEGLDRLGAMLQAILDLAEAEGRALVVHPEEVDLAALCRDMVDLYEPAAQEHGLELLAEAESPVAIRADPLLLQRAVGNLLDNALHHLRRGARVVATARFAVGGQAELAVEDDADGFPDDLAGSAFERSVRRPGSPGLGLGLALVRAVARAHGGEALLGRSRLGGAAVTLRLPP